MLPILFLSFREFLEAWLVVGLFLGLSKQLNLGREREILTAVIVGMCIALVIPSVVFLAGGHIREVWNEATVDLVQGWIMVVVSFVIATVALSLHRLTFEKRKAMLEGVKNSMRMREFNIALFVTIAFCVIREGLEVGLFALSIVLVTPVSTLFLGLLIGFVCAGGVGGLVMIASKRISVKRILSIVEYALMFIGAAIFKNGLTLVLNVSQHIDLKNFGRMTLSFMPNSETSIFGHVMNNLFGIERDFSFAKLVLLLAYIGVVHYFVIRKGRTAKPAGISS